MTRLSEIKARVSECRMSDLEYLLSLVEEAEKLLAVYACGMRDDQRARAWLEKTGEAT